MTAGVKQLQCEALAVMLKKDEPLTLIDVREREEFATDHIDGSRCIPLTELSAFLSSTDPQEQLVFVCEVGGRSLQAATFAASVGFGNVSSLELGMQGWRAAGLGC